MNDIENTMHRTGLIKVPESQSNESVYRRVAKFLYIIGVEQSAQVLKNLSQEQIIKVVTELATIRAVPQDEAEQILQEFAHLYNSEKRNSGGVSRVKEILTSAFGDQKATDIIARAVPEQEIEPFVFLHDIDDQRLKQLLADELPATVALVLSKLPPKQAAAYISALEAGQKTTIVKRLAKMEPVSREIFNRTHDSLSKKFVALQEERPITVDGRTVLVNILKNSDADFEQTILANLVKSDSELTQDIKRRLFSIDDIPRLEGKAFQELLKEMTDAEVAMLLVGKSTSFKEKILAEMSKNRTKYVLEERAVLHPSRQDVTKVTTDFLNKIRIAKQAGSLYLLNKDEEWIR